MSVRERHEAAAKVRASFFALLRVSLDLERDISSMDRALGEDLDRVAIAELVTDALTILELAEPGVAVSKRRVRGLWLAQRALNDAGRALLAQEPVQAVQRHLGAAESMAREIAREMGEERGRRRSVPEFVRAMQGVRIGAEMIGRCFAAVARWSVAPAPPMGKVVRIGPRGRSR